jgi:hypothetical protein
MRFPILSLGLAAAVAAWGCAAPRAPSPSAPAAPTAAPSEPPVAPSATTLEETAVSAPSPTSSAPALSPTPVDASSASPEPADPLAPRQVIYRTSPDSLVVEVDGLRFVPRAIPVHLPNGSYGVRVEVTLEARDEHSHHLLAPPESALSFFSRVFDKRGNLVAEHTDQREGIATRIISPGMKEVLTRAWPANSKAGVVWWGQTLRLEVGLWGLGRLDAERRPLKRLFVVELKATANPKPRILPPELP